MRFKKTINHQCIGRRTAAGKISLVSRNGDLFAQRLWSSIYEIKSLRKTYFQMVPDQPTVGSMQGKGFPKTWKASYPSDRLHDYVWDAPYKVATEMLTSTGVMNPKQFISIQNVLGEKGHTEIKHTSHLQDPSDGCIDNVYEWHDPLWHGDRQTMGLRSLKQISVVYRVGWAREPFQRHQVHLRLTVPHHCISLGSSLELMKTCSETD